MAITSLKARAEDKNDSMVGKKTHFSVNPLTLVEVEEFNLRDYDDLEVIDQIEGFYESYRDGKFVPTLVVWTNPETGETSPVEGHLRRRGALKLVERHPEVLTERIGPTGKSIAPFTLEVQEFRGTEAERIALMLRSEKGLKLKPWKIAEGYLRLHERHVPNSEIATIHRKTPQHVEQMLLLAKAGPEVLDLVKSGKVDAQAAVEMIRKHKENAAQVLMDKHKEVVAVGGKTVTRGSLKEWTPATPIVSQVIKSVGDVMGALTKDARTMLAKYETMSPEVTAAELGGKMVQVDAATLVALLKANGAVLEAKEKKERKEAAAKAAASQGAVDLDGAAGDADQSDEE